MFKNLFNLSLKRTGAEIFGFYLFYSIAGSIVAGFICGILIYLIYPQAVVSNDIQKLVTNLFKSTTPKRKSKQ